mgnify:CR=1 FL=1
MDLNELCEIAGDEVEMLVKVLPEGVKEQAELRMGLRFPTFAGHQTL